MSESESAHLARAWSSSPNDGSSFVPTAHLPTSLRYGKSLIDEHLASKSRLVSLKRRSSIASNASPSPQEPSLRQHNNSETARFKSGISSVVNLFNNGKQAYVNIPILNLVASRLGFVPHPKQAAAPTSSNHSNPRPFLSQLLFNASNWTALSRLPKPGPSRASRAEKIVVKSSDELFSLLEAGVRATEMDIRGRSQPWRQSENGELLANSGYTTGDATRADGRRSQLKHPVIDAIWQRARSGSKPGNRTDNYKIALAIEGGGLRGSVTAGMASALIHLDLADSFDMVLGSSAGSIIGTYLVGRAPPKNTYTFFCNHLTTSKDKLNGSSWLDIGRLMDLFTPGGMVRGRNSSKSPVMVLDYPTKKLMQEIMPVDWKKFVENDKYQAMKVIATGLFSEGSVTLGSEEGSFTDLASLCQCVKASCMLPGVAGVEPQWLRGRSSKAPWTQLEGRSKWLRRELSKSLRTKIQAALSKQASGTPRPSKVLQVTDQFIEDILDVVTGPASAPEKKRSLRQATAEIGIDLNDSELAWVISRADRGDNADGDISDLAQKRWQGPIPSSDVEPLVDALIYEPIPYRSALKYGCTHVLVLRSYPDGKLLPRSLFGIFEQFIAPKCLDPFPEVKQHLQTGGHTAIYAEDILYLNEAVSNPFAENENSEVDAARDEGRRIAALVGGWQGLIDQGVVTMSAPRPEKPHLFAIAPLDTDGEVSQLTLKRELLLQGIMQGFTRAYDILIPDGDKPDPLPGALVAAQVFLPIHSSFLHELEQHASIEKRMKKGGTQRIQVKGIKEELCKPTKQELDMRRLSVGRTVPKVWEVGTQYVHHNDSQFTHGELVVADRSSGQRTLGKVLCSTPLGCVTLVEDSNERSKASISYRVYEPKAIGKIQPWALLELSLMNETDGAVSNEDEGLLGNIKSAWNVGRHYAGLTGAWARQSVYQWQRQREALIRDQAGTRSDRMDKNEAAALNGNPSMTSIGAALGARRRRVRASKGRTRNESSGHGEVTELKDLGEPAS